jgi:predicted LPLAT superfamily acyltransferase
LTGRKERSESNKYLKRLQYYANATGENLPEGLNSFNHFLSFGRSILDKVAAWNGDIKLRDVDFPTADVYREVVASGKGVLVIGSHLGNLELCRALGDHVGDVNVNSLVFTQHAERFNYMLKSINPRVNINLIQVSDMGPDTAILLKQKIDAGEWVFIVADRTPITTGKSNVWVDFLGEKAPFPQGPFVLASLLRCPVYLMFGLNEADGFRVHFESFSEKLSLPRGDRQKALKVVVQDFANRLGHHCMNAPLDWFNFFEFWKEPDENNDA